MNFPRSINFCILLLLALNSISFAEEQSVVKGGRVTFDMLHSSQSRDDSWLQYGRNYAAWRHAPLDAIVRSNVSKLELMWQFDFELIGGLEATPLVHAEKLYISSAFSQLYCLNAADGKLLWKYEHPIEPGTQYCCGPVNRGVALAEDLVIFGTLDADLVALNAITGERVWEAKVGDPLEGISITGAPLVIKDMVITGMSGAEFGVRGFLDSYDIKTGERRWRFWTVPGPGEPGNETWGEDSWKHGGGTTWVTGTYDPELDLLYWGTSNPAPDFDGSVRPGDNLYTNCIVALDPDTGSMAWYYQMTPHDIFDWSGVSEGILVDTEIDGKPAKALVQANRNGFLYALDRKTGSLLYAKAYTKVTWADYDSRGKPALKPSIAQTVAKHVFPGRTGGKNWPPASYSPTSQMIYIPDKELGSTFVSRTTEYFKGGYYLGGSARDDASGDGFLTAVDVRDGEVKWRFKFEGQPNWAGTLSTAGGLVFAGGPDGIFRAFDELTGEVLWEYKTSDSICAPPISFMLQGEQVIGVAAGSIPMSGRPAEASVFYLFGLSTK